jgi:glycosyltransferase involved in cell wall biosynthesis
MELVEPLVSIVVPMYKVEDFISQCVESLLAQTYANFEVILVDDGSPDSSGLMADEFAQEDSRVRVVHKENGGVSSARNAGLDLCRGDYVCFVDGDDRVSEDFLSYMMSMVGITGANFVMSSNCFRFPGSGDQVDADRIEVLSGDCAASLLMYPGVVEIGCWNKLFRVGFLRENNIRFSSSFRMGEGLSFIVHAAEFSGRVGVGRRRVYYYRRDNDLSATTVVDPARYKNALAAIEDIGRTTTIRSSRFRTSLLHHRYMTVFLMLRTVLQTGDLRRWALEYKWCLSQLRARFFLSLKVKASFLRRGRLILYTLFPRASHFLFARIKA